MSANFTHLHVASAYSMRYGTATPAVLAARARALGMPALALTDRDGLYGAIKHAEACAREGIAPILGADLALREISEEPRSRLPRRQLRSQRANGIAGPPPRLANETAARVTLLACGSDDALTLDETDYLSPGYHSPGYPGPGANGHTEPGSPEPGGPEYGSPERGGGGLGDWGLGDRELGGRGLGDHEHGRAGNPRWGSPRHSSPKHGGPDYDGPDYGRRGYGRRGYDGRGDDGRERGNWDYDSPEYDTQEYDSASHSSASHSSASHSNPGHGGPGHGGPGHGSPGHSSPGHGNPGHSNPGHSNPGHGSPGHSSPGHSNPGHDGPGHGSPRSGSPDRNGPRWRAPHGGWASLCRLVSAAHQSGERGVPQVTPDLVADHAEGLVVLLGPASDVGRAVAARRTDLAVQALARWRDRADTVIEITDHHGPGDTQHARHMLQFAREQGVPAVLTNGARYLDPADAPLAQVLDAARQLTPLGRRHLTGHNAQAYLKDGEQMARVAARICGTGSCRGPRSCPGRCGDPAHELLATTAALARRCRLDGERDLGLGLKHLPEVAGEAAFVLLKQRCTAGMVSRGLAGPQPPPGVRRARARRREEAAERLDRELHLIHGTGLASYFLTVADVAALIRARGIRCAIRGSGAGCLVNYLIGISDIDPLDHGLIMERFLAEGRTTLPDIDLDVESARRIEAYRAIIDRYGEERCGCVSMMETYRARSAIRDTAAALGLPPHEIDTIAKAFGHIRARGIRGALADLPELRASNLAIPQLTSLFKLAERLDGLPRHIAMHPCGVVLSSATLLDRVPVERSAEGLPLCQFDMDDVEHAGMIKLDVLGVRMQSAMTYALAEIERTRGERVDIDAIRPDDGPTFEMIRSGRTLGCFQIESPGQRELVTRLEPRDIGDLIVDISLFRPGPVNSDMITPYLDIKHHRSPACYPHERLAEPLGETGGVVIFHEQVLRVIDAMTGCGFSYAERLRRRLSDESARAEIHEWFCGAALEHGYEGTIVDRVWDVLEAFGAFGFCKAHAAAFAIPTYQSAWLKRHYPAAFYAGVLTHDPGMYPKRVITCDARLAGIPVLPVDVNASAGDWRVEPLPGDPAEGLRVGLREVKGISDAEVARIIAGRPYASLRDFWERARVSRPVAERLVLVGALDSMYDGLGQLDDGSGEPEAGSGKLDDGPGKPDAGRGKRPTRRDLLARVGVLAGPSRPARGRPVRSLARGATSAEHDLDQLMLDLDGDPGAGAGGGNGGDGFAKLVPAGELPELTVAERVSAELEILGIDVSQHVISFYEELLGLLGVVRARDLHRCASGSSVLVAGVKTSTQTPAIRSGHRIIFATLDDGTGQTNLAFFESVQERCASRVFGSWLLIVRGRVRRPDDRRSRVPGHAGNQSQGGLAVSVNAAECWDLAALEEIRLSCGIRAVHAAMAAGDVPGPGATRPAADERRAQAADGPHAEVKVVYPTGFRLSPYAETGSSGAAVKDAPRKLWHASQGSSGGSQGGSGGWIAG